MTVSVATDHTTTELRPTPTAREHLHRIWPATVVAIGLTLTAAWTCLLGYGLIWLVSGS